MATLHHTKQIATVFAATTAQAGYPATNLGNESLKRPWLATGVGAEDVVITFPVVKPIGTFHLHDVNFATANVYKSGDGVAYTLVGAMPSYMGKEGRRRCAIAINDGAVKAIKVSIAAGASTDGLGWWRAGAEYPFASSVAIPPFEFDYRTRFFYPSVRRELVNGLDAIADTGSGFHRITLPFRPDDNQDLEPLVRYARAATVLLDLGMANYPWQLWPVRLLESQMDEGFREPKRSELTLDFKEVVA